MPLYMYQAAYTAESLAAQLKKPENRVEAVGRSICEAVGGKLVGGWYCFGDYDLAIVADVPNNEAMAAIALARADDRSRGRSGHEEGRGGHQGLQARPLGNSRGVMPAWWQTPSIKGTCFSP